MNASDMAPEEQRTPQDVECGGSSTGKNASHPADEPFPSKADGSSAPEAETESASEKPASPQAKSMAARPRKADPFLRAANEDDDGYDPYSDRPAYTPLFEEDPWK